MQFMTIELLSAIETRTNIKHLHKHDIESFAWVFVYSILRKLISLVNISTPEEMGTLNGYFHRSFGGLTVHAILDNRMAAGPFSFASDGLLADRFLPLAMTDHLRYFLVEFRAYVLRYIPLPTPPKEFRHQTVLYGTTVSTDTPYTYEWLRSAFTDVIDGLNLQSARERNYRGVR